MSLSLTQKIKLTFDLASLRHEASLKLTGDEWKGYQIIRKRYETDRRVAESTYRKEYDSRVETVRAEASSTSVIRAFEEKIEKLEQERLLLTEKAAPQTRARYTFEELFELSIKFLSNPWNLWRTGQFDLQRLVLRLAFCDHLTYCRETGSLNTKKSMPFKALDRFYGEEKGMVPLR